MPYSVQGETNTINKNAFRPLIWDLKLILRQVFSTVLLHNKFDQIDPSMIISQKTLATLKMQNTFEKKYNINSLALLILAELDITITL